MECGKEIPDDSPCLLLIRYPGAYNLNARNSLIKNFSIHHIYDGNVAGVGEYVNVLEGVWQREASVAVLCFDTKKSAEMWYNCTPDIKQSDWLSGVDMVLVPLRNKGSPNTYLEILDIKFKDRNKFYSEYVPQCAKYMEGKPGDIAVVSAENIIRLRGQWDPGFIVINQFPTEADFSSIYRSDEYEPIRKLRQETADANVITVQLNNIFRNKSVPSVKCSQ